MVDEFLADWWSKEVRRKTQESRFDNRPSGCIFFFFASGRLCSEQRDTDRGGEKERTDYDEGRERCGGRTVGTSGRVDFGSVQPPGKQGVETNMGQVSGSS